MITLRDYQNIMSDGARQAFSDGYKSPLVVGPTGCGKTVLFSYIALNAALKGNRILIIVHRDRLMKQTSRTLSDFGVEHGLIAAGITPDLSQHVQVASVWTLIRRLEKLTWCPDLILVDEAHHAIGKTTWGKILAYYGKCVIGFTATPERLDGNGLGVSAGGIFDKLVMGPEPADLIERGFLSKPVIFGAPEEIDTSQMHTKMGDWDKKEGEAAVDKPRIIGNAVTHYKRLSHNEPGIAFCASIKHAEHVAEAFSQGGYQSACIHGKIKQAEQDRMIKDLGNGSLHVLTSCDLISEGTDIPVVSVGIMLRLTQSLALALQQQGRVLRPFPGKKRGLIIDHVSNWSRHGFPQDHRDWTLEGNKRSGRKKEEKELNVRQCNECFHVHLLAPRCPNCGYEYPIQGREIEQVDGELIKLNPEEIKLKRQQRIKKAKTREELEAIASEMKFKPGWVDYVLRARQAAHQQWKTGKRRRA